MANDGLLKKVQDLSDVELAALLCFAAQEHCIIDTQPDALDDLVNELRLIASNIFGLTHAVVDCNKLTTLDDFADSLLSDAVSPSHNDSPTRPRQDSYFLNAPPFRSVSRSPRTDSFGTDNRQIANVIITKNLDEAPLQVQIQALELLRTKRIFTHTAVQNAPKRFLFIAAIAGGDGPRLTKHLNDYMFLSHFHDSDDGFPNLEDLGSDGDSISSVVKRKAVNHQVEAANDPLFSSEEIEILETKAKMTTVTVEMQQYMHNIISFMRMHRAVNGGISPQATRHFDKLVRYMAPLQGMDFVTPSLVALAARKIYPHRIEIVAPENERSLQWGSSLSAVTAALDGVGPDDVIEDVLETVEVPI